VLELVLENESDLPTIEVDKVIVTERFREDLGDLEPLKQSVKRLGFLHPIGVTEDNKLVYGRRRLEVAKQLGLHRIPCVIVHLGEFEQKVAELEENLRRKNLSWVEEVKAKAELDRLLREIHGEQKPGRPKNSLESNELWDYDKTADFLGESRPLVSQDIQLARLMEQRPELADLPTKSAAKKQMYIILHGEERNPFEESSKPSYDFECPCGRRYRIEWEKERIEQVKG